MVGRLGGAGARRALGCWAGTTERQGGGGVGGTKGGMEGWGWASRVGGSALFKSRTVLEAQRFWKLTYLASREMCVCGGGGGSVSVGGRTNAGATCLPLAPPLTPDPKPSPPLRSLEQHDRGDAEEDCVESHDSQAPKDKVKGVAVGCGGGGGGGGVSGERGWLGGRAGSRQGSTSHLPPPPPSQPPSPKQAGKAAHFPPTLNPPHPK